ncbi:hypothetical protein IMG5_121760 [Ichthyophthirius multifiliis]|uniref:Uncharacterized protein n=1 Tax=Ichthyophthirius multifiliis TaxID=5932 RepID=G0QV77_ICHMU|nr:hypothetical protein IMG5_121760 [Ichthyophthirius multifiliis]EGR30878.1 hypothetical protein IMG5_121760 [Ichthyophthirius multifiliis]|eukprot:XP_004032465.1 hypothetical protein IMG5_121760 [Ichthyophthirius multifiliis]
MSSYIIAGSADKEEMAICENILNQIKSLFFNIDFRIIIKDESEWKNYINEICRIYGFKKKLNPIIFTLDGYLIGSLENFKELALSKFGIDKYDNLVTKEKEMDQIHDTILNEQEEEIEQISNENIDEQELQQNEIFQNQENPEEQMPRFLLKQWRCSV